MKSDILLSFCFWAWPCTSALLPRYIPSVILHYMHVSLPGCGRLFGLQRDRTPERESRVWGRSACLPAGAPLRMRTIVPARLRGGPAACTCTCVSHTHSSTSATLRDSSGLFGGNLWESSSMASRERLGEQHVRDGAEHARRLPFLCGCARLGRRLALCLGARLQIK